jgi:hypothetical protein
MHRQKEDTRVVIENILGSVAMMDIEVDHQDTIEAMNFDRMPGSNGYMIQQAEAHGRLLKGMVPGGPNSAEGPLGFAPQDTIDGIDHRPGG